MQVLDHLERGRDAYARRAWTDAYESLSRADEAVPLRADDLDVLATTAFMLGRDDDVVRALERAHHAYLELGETLRAVHSAVWICLNLATRGEVGPATGWLGRARRLLERESLECAEHGY